MPPPRVTEEQPAHFRPVSADLVWPSLTADPDPTEGWPARVYGLGSPGEGVTVGFHGAGAECTPDTRDCRPDPTRLARLQEYVRRWLPGLDPESAWGSPASPPWPSPPTRTTLPFPPEGAP